MDKKSPINMIACILLVVGGLNWGLVGIGQFIGANLNLVNILFGWAPVIERIVYIVVGISAIVHAMSCMKGCNCSNCEVKK